MFKRADMFGCSTALRWVSSCVIAVLERLSMGSSLVSHKLWRVQGISIFFFSWRPKFQRNNTTWPKQKNMYLPTLVRGVRFLSFTEFIEVLGYFGHSTYHFGQSTPQVRTFMAFLFLKCWYYSFLRQEVFLGGSQKGPRPKLKASATHSYSIQTYFLYIIAMLCSYLKQSVIHERWAWLLGHPVYKFGVEYLHVYTGTLHYHYWHLKRMILYTFMIFDNRTIKTLHWNEVRGSRYWTTVKEYWVMSCYSSNILVQMLCHTYIFICTRCPIRILINGKTKATHESMQEQLDFTISFYMLLSVISHRYSTQIRLLIP